MWGTNTSANNASTSNDDPLMSQVYRFCLKKYSLRFVIASVLNGQTQDATCEMLAAFNLDGSMCIAKIRYDSYVRKIWDASDEVGHAIVELARTNFIEQGGGCVAIAIDGGWSHRIQASEHCVQLLDVSRESAIISTYTVMLLGTFVHYPVGLVLQIEGI